MSVFRVVEYSEDDEIECIGTATAISAEFVLTTWDNAYVRVEQRRYGVIGQRVVVQRCRFASLLNSNIGADLGTLKTSDLIALTVVDCDEDEGWCVLRRELGTFETFTPLCHEDQLPLAGKESWIHDALIDFEYGGIRCLSTSIEWYHPRNYNPKKRKIEIKEDDTDLEKNGVNKEKVEALNQEQKTLVADLNEQSANITSASPLATDSDTAPVPLVESESTAPIVSGSSVVSHAPVAAVNDFVRLSTRLKADAGGQSSGCPLVTSDHTLFAMRIESRNVVLSRLSKFMTRYNAAFMSEKDPVAENV